MHVGTRIKCVFGDWDLYIKLRQIGKVARSENYDLGFLALNSYTYVA